MRSSGRTVPAPRRRNKHAMPQAAETSGRDKSAAAFRTISEVAAELDLPQHVLRFWESRFTQVRPLKRGGGRRYYRPEDIELLRAIRELLYDDGYTIKGVQKLLRGGGVRPEPAGGEPDDGDSGGTEAAASEDVSVGALTAAQRVELEAMLDELQAVRAMLARHL